MLRAAVEALASFPVLERLGRFTARKGLGDLSARLYDIRTFLADDLEGIEAALAGLEVPRTVVGQASSHLLEVGGKRLRPLCVALASRLGTGFGPTALDLAVAVELVHNATLLHDDVVDLAETRRGTRTARAEYGNAASIFAGDWLLIEALRRVGRTGVPGVLEALLDTIEEMILAESLQLENRGRLDAGREVYFQVAEGKTAALFRWAMESGGHAGGLQPAQCRALGQYGMHLGVAFQVVDDLLDVVGDSASTGKNLFTDLREGMLTFPLIVALERRPETRAALTAILEARSGDEVDATLYGPVVAAVHETGAAEACRQLANDRAQLAARSLSSLPDGRARRALVSVVETTVHRNR